MNQTDQKALQKMIRQGFIDPDAAELNTDAENYFAMAVNTNRKDKMMQYLKKALKENPDYFEAEMLLVTETSENEFEALQKAETILEHAKQVMIKNGYLTEKNIGSFWGIFETRDYIRFLRSVAQLYLQYSMYSRAASILEEVIRLNESDNTGARDQLFAIYAVLEQEEKAMKLKEKFDLNETTTLLSLCILKFRLAKFDEADMYLEQLETINPDTQNFVAMIAGEMDPDEEDFELMDQYGGYRPNTIQEYLSYVDRCDFAIENTHGFVLWLCRKYHIDLMSFDDNFDFDDDTFFA